MSKQYRRGGHSEADYVDEEEIATNVRDEKLLIDEELTGTDDSGYDGVDILSGNNIKSRDDEEGGTDIYASANRGGGGVELGGVKRQQKKGGSNRATDPLGYYKVMGVSPTADAATIRKAFLALSATYHSDKHSQQDELAQGYMNERFQQLSEAYEVLSDPRRRAAYDHSGSLGISRLELVPLSAVNPTDVKKHLSLLQAEAQLKKAERLLSSSSSATIHISAAHHFSSYKALGLMKGVDDDDDDTEDDNTASATSRRPRGPNISAFAAKTEENNNGPIRDVDGSEEALRPNEPTSTAANTSVASDGLSSSFQKEDDSNSDDDIEDKIKLNSSSTVPDDLTDEEKAFLEEQIAYQKHMEREAAEKSRLLEAIHRAPPRWDPSHRGIAMPYQSQQSFFPPPLSTADQSESSPRAPPSAESSSETTATASEATPQKESHEGKEAEAQHQKQQGEEKEGGAHTDKEGSAHQDESPKPKRSPHPQHVPSAANSGNPQQASAQLAEVMINGKPTLVAILPAQVAAQVRAQMGGGIAKHHAGEEDTSSTATGAGAISGEEGGGAQPQAISDEEAKAMAKMTPQERKAHHKGILRKVATAKAQQALREMPLMVLLSLDFIHMYNYPIGDRTNITFRASAKKNMDSNAGSDGANVGLSLEHVLSPLSKIRLNLKATFNLLKLQFSHTRVLSAASTFTNKVTLYAGGYFLRDFSMSLTRRLSSALSMTNTLTLSAGRSGGSFSTSAQYVLNSHAMAAGSLDIGFGSLSCGTNYVAKLSKKVKASIALRSNLLGGSTECSYELWYARNQLEQIGLGAAVAIPYSYNVITGITSSPQPMRLTQFFILLARGDHSIRIPIVVVVNDHVAKILLFGAIPALTVSAVRLLTKPFSNLHKAKAYQRARSLHVKNVAAARRRAQIEMLALHSFVQKKRAIEETVSGGGLVILKATYGVLHPEVAVLPPLADVVETLVSPMSSTTSPIPQSSAFSEIGVADPEADDPNTFSLTVDVTNALQSLVHNSALVLAEGSKDGLPGFFDVDPGTKERRYISVKYLFKKRIHKVEIDAEEALTLPMEEHVDLSGAQ